MPRVKLHRPTSPDDRPQAPQDEFVPAEPQHERTSYLPNVKQQALELFREGCGYKRTASLLGLPAYTVRDWARLYREGKFHPQSNNPNLFE